jgi:hypothetical protein
MMEKIRTEVFKKGYTPKERTVPNFVNFGAKRELRGLDSLYSISLHANGWLSIHMCTLIIGWLQANLHANWCLVAQPSPVSLAFAIIMSQGCLPNNSNMFL